MEQRDLPLSMVTLVFGILSIPLAFARQLCVPALIMGLLAIGFYLWGRRKQKVGGYSSGSLKRSSLGFKLALVGSACSLMMWVLWATNSLF
ncbi:MAG: hypothetical protein ABI373_09015 [Flavobacteriales bacterium]